MAMVGVVSGTLYRRTHSLNCASGLVLGRLPLGAILHSSNEPGELSQWLCHDDSTINIVVVIIIIIIVPNISPPVFWDCFPALCYASAAYAVMQCPSVCLSRSYIQLHCVKSSNRIFTFFHHWVAKLF